MSDSPDVSPFPPLKWDGWTWRGKCAFDWFRSKQKTELLVHTVLSQAANQVPQNDAPVPTPPQATAFRCLSDPQSHAGTAILGALQEQVPDVGWQNPGQHLELSEVHVYQVVQDDVAYTGFVFNTIEYEHGIGVVAHRDRVVKIGNAEEAEMKVAEKDLARINRGKTKKP